MITDNYIPYKEGEEHQYIIIKVICNTRHNPGTPEHLKQLVVSHFAPKGITIVEEEGKLITYV